MRVASVSSNSPRNAVYLTTLSISGSIQRRALAGISTDEWEKNTWQEALAGWIYYYYFNIIMHEDWSLPKCDAVSFDQLFSTFRKIVDVFPFTGKSIILIFQHDRQFHTEKNLNNLKYRNTNQESQILCQNLVAETEENHKIGQSGQQPTSASPRYKRQQPSEAEHLIRRLFQGNKTTRSSPLFLLLHSGNATRAIQIRCRRIILPTFCVWGKKKYSERRSLCLATGTKVIS